MSYKPMTLYDPDSDESSSDDGYGDMKASFSIANKKCGMKDSDDEGWSIDSDLLEPITEEEFEPDSMPTGKGVGSSDKYNKAKISLKDDISIGSDSDYEMATKVITGLDIDEHGLGSDDEYIPQTVSNTKKQFTKNDKEFDALVPTSSKPHALEGGVGGGRDEGGDDEGGGSSEKRADVRASTPPPNAPQPEIISALAKIKSLRQAGKGKEAIFTPKEVEMDTRAKKFAEESAKRRAVKMLRAEVPSKEEKELDKKADAFRKQQIAKKGVQALTRQVEALPSKKVLLTEKQTRAAMKEVGEKAQTKRQSLEAIKNAPRFPMGDFTITKKSVAGSDKNIISFRGKELTGSASNVDALEEAMRVSKEELKNPDLTWELYQRLKRAQTLLRKKQGTARAYTKKTKIVPSPAAEPSTVSVGGNIRKLNV